MWPCFQLVGDQLLVLICRKITLASGWFILEKCTVGWWLISQTNRNSPGIFVSPFENKDTNPKRMTSARSKGQSFPKMNKIPRSLQAAERILDS
jgi:hypothetical protein